MKLKQLLAVALMAIGGSAWAQQAWTDVTSKITNPSFETDNAIADLTKSAWATNGVTGWTVLPASASNAQVGVGNASSTLQGGAGTKSNPAAGEKFFYTRNNWNANTNFSVEQTISSDLPAGLYMLTLKIKAASSSPNSTKYTISLQEGDKAAVTNTNPGSAAEWLNCGVLINKTEDNTSLTIKADMLPGAANSGQHYVMMIDDVQLKYLSTSDIDNLSPENTLDVSGVIYNAGIYNANNKENMPRGWTAFKSTRGNKNYTSGTGDTQLEGWIGNATMDIDYYQQINGLPAGKYRLIANCHDSNAKGAVAYIYNDGTKEKQTVTMTKDYSDITTPSLIVNDGNAVNIGISANVKDSWVTGDNFRLDYLGSGIDLTAWKAAKADAEAALAEYDEKYAATERAAVIAAKIAANPTTDEEAASMPADLNLKIATYRTKAANEKLVEGKAGLVEAIARITNSKGEYPNSSDAVLNPDISKWTTSTYTVMNSNQHWSGVGSYRYYEQSTAQWGQNTWSLEAEQTINLPAGKYAFVVTARASSGVVSKMTIDGQEVALSTNGDVGYGIATDGECTYDMSKTYANNGTGRGWEYAYAEFEVASAKDVTFRLESSTSAAHNWVSIANPVLYYNDAAKAGMEKINAKAELNNALLAVTAKPAENIGDGAFQYSQANVDAYQGVIDAAQAVYDDAEATTQQYNDAKATLDNIQYPALNDPANGTAYKMVQNNLNLNPETNNISSTESAVWFEAVTGGYKIKSNTGKYIKYEGSNNWTMTTTDDANSAAVFAVEYTAQKGLTFRGSKGLYGGDANTDGAEMYGNKGTGNKVFWSVSEAVIADDYTALNTAIATAEAKTLGFENGEYAPYNNVDALNALATAKAINQTIPNVASVVENITNTLSGATWTANDGDAAIVYNGDMLEMDGTSPKGWNGAGWGQQNDAVDGKKVYYFNSARTVQYGTVEGYTMPLKAATVYQLTYSYGSQGNNSCKGLNVSVKLGEEVMESHDFGAFGTLYGTALKTVSMKFTTTVAGNYTLNFPWNGNVGITDVQVVKVVATDIAGTTVEAANGWGTFISPVDREIPAGLKAYTCSTIDNDVLTLEEADAIEANTAYILENASGADVAILAKNAIDPSNSYDVHTTGVLTGVYSDIDAPNGSYILQNHDGHVAFFLVDIKEAQPKVRANRAYLTVPVASAKPRMLRFGSDEETAISAVEALVSGKAEIYSVNGVKLNKLQKGINIVNGKKIMVK